MLFRSGFSNGGSDGLAVGTLWLWLLCLVVCWFWVLIYSSSEIEDTSDSNKTTKYFNNTLIRSAIDMFNRTTGTKTDNPEESNLSPSATHSPHGIGGIQSVHRSSTNIEHPAGAQPSLQPDTDGLLIPFTNVQLFQDHAVSRARRRHG